MEKANLESSLLISRQHCARAEAQLSSYEASAKAAIAKLEAQVAEASAAQSRLHKAVEESNVSHLSQLEELRSKSKEASEKTLRLEAELERRAFQQSQAQPLLEQQAAAFHVELSQKTIALDVLYFSCFACEV